MIILGSTEAECGMLDAADKLSQDAEILSALVKGVSNVESNPNVRSVGLGGWPNLLGEMECDGAVMHGTSREVGAVGAVKETLHVASLAHAVLEQIPHVMLTGEGARRFADEIGLPRHNMLIPHSARTWRKKIAVLTGQDPTTPFVNARLAKYLTAITDPERIRDTVVFLGVDAQSNFGVATSTSGWAWKYPGRLGDSPVTGAGYYADSRYGAAACTHTGEMAIRSATAMRVVQALEFGLGLSDAVARAADDLLSLTDGFLGEVVIHAIDRDENHQVLHLGTQEPTHYWLWTSGMKEPEQRHAHCYP